MPTFKYRCDSFHTHEHFFQTLNPPAETLCDTCGAPAQKVFLGGNVKDGSQISTPATPVFRLGFGQENYATRGDRKSWFERINVMEW